MDQIRIGIVGAGRLGCYHAEKAALNKEVTLVGVVDPLEANRKKIAQRFNIPDFANPEELLELVDAVVIATPPSSHFSIGSFFLKNGKHVLMEKPLATTGDNAKELVRLAEEKDLILLVGHVEQHNPAWVACSDLLEEIRNGQNVLIEARRCGGYSFRSSDVSVVFDLLVHDLELVLSVLGSDVSQIKAWGFSQIGGSEDLVSADLFFENGSNARLFASRIAQSPERVMRIYSPQKKLEIDFQTRSVRIVSPDCEILAGNFAPEKVDVPSISAQIPSFMTDHYHLEEIVAPGCDALALEMDDFCSAILRKTPLRVPALRAAKTVELAEEIVRDLQIPEI